MRMNYWYWLLGWFLCCSTNIYAQLPCGTQLDVISENTDGDRTAVICNNSPLTLYASITPTNCPTCTYQWSTGSTNTFEFAFAPGTYSVTVTDNGPNGCVWLSVPITISATILARPTLTQDSINICSGVRKGVNFTDYPVMEVSNVCTRCLYEFYENRSPLSTPFYTAQGTAYTAQGVLASPPITNSGDYFVRVIDPSSSCTEDSEPVTIGQRTVSVPTATASTHLLCDTNTTILSTINCAGCSYQWQYYDYQPKQKLIISGVYDATRGNNTPSGIELYAIGNVIDLSQYSIEVSNGVGALIGTFNFPISSVGQGDYIYISNSNVEFFEFFGFSPNYVSSVINLNGAYRITLVHNGTPVDKYGEGAVGTWNYADGWAYREDQHMPSATFDPSEWTFRDGTFNISSRDNDFWGTDRMNIGTYTTPALPNTEIAISAVFADVSGANKARGIELYTFGTVDDLSDYSVRVYTPGGASTIPLVGGAVSINNYLYLTDDANNLINYLGVPTGGITADPRLSTLVGRHAIALFKDTTMVDVYGDTTLAQTSTWDYTGGWAKSVNNRVPSTIFNIAQWTNSPNAWANCTATTNNLCANPLAVANTRFTLYPSKLIVSGVFDYNSPIPVRGIELFAVSDIDDLSLYDVILREAGPLGNVDTVFLTGRISRGGFIYISNSIASNFNSRFTVSPTAPFIQNPHMDSLDGDDVIDIEQSGRLVDRVGSTNGLVAIDNNTASWSFEDGWLYRRSGTVANNGIFSVARWYSGKHNYRPRNDVFGPNRFPLATYDNSTPGTIGSDIGGANSHIYRTGQVGDYIVRVTLPNGCPVNSDTVAIDTLVFEPSIIAVMTSSNDTSDIDNISYLCDGSTVILSMREPFFVPPSWSYQWSKDGIDLPGENGYNYTATSSGLYRVRVVDDNGCTSYSNSIRIFDADNGANPTISASSQFLCPSDPTSMVELITAPCTDCQYQWFEQSGTFRPSVQNMLELTNGSAGGYYVEVTDIVTGCKYQSPIVLINDTTYSAPILTTSGNTICSATPINISTQPCPGCRYQWEIEGTNDTTFNVLKTSAQAIERIDSSGKYRMRTIHSNGCITNYSNTIQATFLSVNANIAPPASLSVCNGAPVAIQALPDTDDCVGCTYEFLRNQVRMLPGPLPDSQSVSLDGNYQVIITNDVGCSDTSNVIQFQEVNVSASISTSARKICSPTASVTMYTDSCSGCTFQWYINNNNIITQRDTFYSVTGYAAANNTYRVDVMKNGCVAMDSFLLDSVLERVINIEIDSSVSTTPTMCDGSYVKLKDVCDACVSFGDYTVQWYLDGNLIPTAVFESYLIDTPGFYRLYSLDNNGCEAISNTMQVQAFDPAVGLALDFSALGSAVPITYGRFDLNDHLQPISLRNRGTYSSVTAQSAININTDTINVGIAGPGYHYITFSYTDSNALGSCTFSTFDTLYVLGSVSIDIANSRVGVPPTEACIGDVLDITLTNFTFVPNEVQFVTAGGGTISVPVTPALTLFAGVFSGTFQVTVPQGARTGKIRVTDGSSSFESPNFFAINNPSVAVSLSSTSQPICSSLDSALFSGVPLGGSYSAYLFGNTTTPLTTDSLLWLDSVRGYTNGVQYVTVYYQYTPTYTGTTIGCAPITDSLLVEVRDASLDSVDYTPISITQPSESLYNLTRVVYPISASNYPSSYTGTYVLANNLLASTVPLVNNAIGREPITYQVSNSGCVNQSVDTIDIWPKPSLLDSIPIYLCSQADTVFIQRNRTTGDLEVYYRNNLVYSNSLYRYQENLNVPVGSGPDILYNEYINRMVVRSSNGGIDSINFRPPFEEYYFVPANVNGNSTQVTFDFSYSRTATYFSGGVPTNTVTTDYTIASVTKNFIIENPSQVAINPAILADTVFCPLSGNNQLLGIPAGGQFYIRGGNLGYRGIPNNILNPLGAVGTTVPDLNETYRLIYVYRGQACVDSAAANIFLSDTFTVSVRPGNVTGLYCETSPNDTILFELPYTTQTSIDTASAQFFVRGILSGTIFSPMQVGPPGDYRVRYVVSDIYGCTEEASDTFTIFPIPDLAMSTVAPRYCRNNDTVSIRLFTTDTTGGVTNFNEVTNWGPMGAIPSTDTAWFTGAGIVGGGQYTATTTPRQPYFHAQLAGEGVHPIRYLYKDQNNCMDSINFDVEVLPLPQVRMTTTGGAALAQVYCENDSIPLFGLPIGTSLTSGYGSDTVISAVPSIPVPSSLDSADTAFEPNIPGTQPGHADETIYYFYEDNNGCRDTARYTIRIRNFTTDPVIAGLRNITPNGERCADDVILPVVADPGTGFDLDSLGWFSSDYQLAFSQLSDTLNTDSISFNPSLTGIEFADREVVLTFHYTDTSRTCYNSISDTVMIWALPYLTLSEQLVSNLGAMDYPGAQLIVPPTDTFYHMCLSALEIPIYAYNTRGVFNPLNGQVTIGTPTHITPDTGRYIMGDGIRSNGGGTNIAYGFTPRLAGPGLDTIRYTYTDPRGCTDTITHYLFVDSLPNLSFAGLSNYDSTLYRYLYCENDTAISILPSPIGVQWDLTFDNQAVTSVPFDLRPDTLAVQGSYMDYILRYDYIGQVYVGGGVCRDSLIDTIQIRPAPRLAWVSVPDNICMSDSNTRIPLSATPYGGTFIDITNNFQVTAGIVGDSLFNPSAQAGRRDVVYYYLDTTSGCDDTIQHTIHVYNQPEINFDIGNGCTGRLITFEPRTEPYGLLYNGVAVDSITQVIWNFGDGMIDTISYLPDTTVIPSDTHTYFNGGVYYPSLTVSNQGVCDTTFIRRIVVSPTVQPTDTMPYVQNFDTGNDGWFQAPADTLTANGIITDSLWQWGIANGQRINTAQDGNFVWGTRLANTPTTYKQGEHAWVYSPCFDLTELERPMIKLSLWKHTKSIIDGAILQFYDDSTQTWTVLGEYGRGINWYDSSFVVSSPGNQVGIPIGWSGISGTWKDARYRLDNIGQDLRGRSNVRFRMAFASDPGTQLGVFDGVAFDSVVVGNRQRNVLVEHFSAVGYPGIGGIERQLYQTIFNNLYGRDVNLIQYHLDNRYTTDNLYALNTTDNRQRSIFYGIQDADLVRVDGGLVGVNSRTSEILNYPTLEVLDVQMLKDPDFDIEFTSFPSVQVGGAGVYATIRITALKDMPPRAYALHAVVTMDSMSTTTGDTTMAVMLDMFPDNNGTPASRAWVTGDFVDLVVQVPNITPALYTPNLIQLVAFVQDNDVTDRTIYQSASTRNLNAFLGSVDSLRDISVDQIEDRPGYEATQINIFPNPTTQGFNIAFEQPLEDNYQWHLVSISGQILQEGRMMAGEHQRFVSTDDLPSGVYVLIFRNEHVYTQRKIVVKRP